jgi:hypothetical protein
MLTKQEKNEILVALGKVTYHQKVLISERKAFAKEVNAKVNSARDDINALTEANNTGTDVDLIERFGDNWKSVLAEIKTLAPKIGESMAWFERFTSIAYDAYKGYSQVLTVPITENNQFPVHVGFGEKPRTWYTGHSLAEACIAAVDGHNSAQGLGLADEKEAVNA